MVPAFVGLTVHGLLPPSELTLRFDGCMRGRAGGAGAVLLHEGRVVWQGARYLHKPPTSAHTEYEALILGLGWARRLGVRRVSAEGDCRLVVRQMEGVASVRKLSRLHSAALALAETMPLTMTHIPRSENAHADCLARAAVDAQEELIAAAVRAAARCGRRSYAVELLCDAARRGVPAHESLYDELMGVCEAEHDWALLLDVFRLARSEGACSTQALRAAMRAHEQSGMLRGPEPASVRRTLAARERRPPHASREPATRRRESRDSKREARPWQEMVQASREDGSSSPPALLALSAKLASAEGLGVVHDG